ncbi:MAG: efflux RND transporter periplasmic adaptor subunit, partial [Candidatus Eisenbacteria bacterium]|nr:efflux RND transporter periplasmic adaptor subunit [Candidatus Eisenbacteria bacterium]
MMGSRWLQLRSMLRLVAAGVAAMWSVAQVGCSEPEAEQPFTTAPVERRSLELSAQAAGVIEPLVVVEVKSKASGEILEVPVETGDWVQKGDLLVLVEQTEVRNNLAQAEADYEVAQAGLRRAEAELERARRMLEARVITAREFEQAELDAAEARAQLIRAEASLETARERLEETEVRAPIAGTIIEKSVEAGQVIASATREVSGGTTLLKMADLHHVQVKTLVDETDVGKIEKGLEAEVRVDAYPQRIFDGRVEKIEPQAQVQQNVTLFPTIISIDNQELLLKPGMSADVTILVARRENVLAVPNQAVKPMSEAAEVARLALGMDREVFQERMQKGASPPAGEDTAAARPGPPPGRMQGQRGRGGEHRGGPP